MNKRVMESLYGVLSVVIVSIATFSCEKDPKVDPPVDPGSSDTTVVVETPPLGLYVKDGMYYKDGNPYFGMGVNWFSLFNSVLSGENTLELQDSYMDALGENGIPFVRFAGPYWPKNWTDTYFTDKESYYKVMDAIVKKAEKDSVGLIPSLFWYVSAIPDLFQEHMDAYCDEDSQTSKFIRSYTAEFVQRYKDSPAIWAWEFGNEFDLCIDIPGGNYPQIVPSLGTAEGRDPVRDNLTHEIMTAAFHTFATTVRLYDSTRAILTGNAEPRAAAWHLANGGNWSRDTEDQYYEMLCKYNDDPIDAIEIRGYCDEYPLGLSSPDQFMAKLMSLSKKAGKPLFVGEFHGGGGHADDKYELQKRIDAIVNNDVQLSAYWVYDYPAHEDSCNATFKNTRFYIMNMIVRANKLLKEKAQDYK